MFNVYCKLDRNKLLSVFMMVFTDMFAGRENLGCTIP